LFFEDLTAVLLQKPPRLFITIVLRPVDRRKRSSRKETAIVVLPDPDAAVLSAEKLNQLPWELIEDLPSATLNGSKKSLEMLIEKLRETDDAGSAQGLQELADKYEYDALTRLLKEACPP
jgi:hypothetical protein